MNMNLTRGIVPYGLIPPLLLGLSFAGCQGPRADVLIEREAATPSVVHETCASVFLSGQKGDACLGLESGCVLKNECSVLTATCVGGVLFFATQDDCPSCQDDLECGAGFLCLDGLCSECTAPRNCPACTNGQTYLTRNGCETCECGPPSECSEKGCSNGQACIRGARCVQGCERLDCCSNVCAQPGCPEPAPVGCITVCDSASCGGKCLAQACTCDLTNKKWLCKGSCDNGQATCSAP